MTFYVLGELVDKSDIYTNYLTLVDSLMTYPGPNKAFIYFRHPLQFKLLGCRCNFIFGATYGHPKFYLVRVIISCCLIRLPPVFHENKLFCAEVLCCLGGGVKFFKNC